MEFTLAISEKDQMIADLKETIEYLKKMVFGRKSEKSKYYDMPGQFDICDMFGVEKPADDNVIERHETAKEISGYTRKEKKKKSTYDEMYENLPAERVVIPVSDKGRICPNCGEEMEHLGEKYVRTEIEVTPAKVKRKDIYQETVICKRCKADDAPTIVEADFPEPLIQHSPATPSTVAYAIYMKLPCRTGS